MLLENWRDTELKFGDQEHIDAINGKMPRKVKK